MSSAAPIEAGEPDRDDVEEPRARPWLAVVGLLVLWGSYLPFAGYAAIAMFIGFGFIGATEPGEERLTALATFGIAVLGLFIAAVLLVIASCGVGWAARAVGALGIGIGLLGWSAVEVLHMDVRVLSAGAVIGGVLILLPPSQRWFRAVAARRRANRTATPEQGS